MGLITYLPPPRLQEMELDQVLEHLEPQVVTQAATAGGRPPPLMPVHGAVDCDRSAQGHRARVGGVASWGCSSFSGSTGHSTRLADSPAPKTWSEQDQS